jgi:FkbH-like protein
MEQNANAAITKLLGLTTHTQAKAALQVINVPLTLAHAQKLTSHLSAIHQPNAQVRLGVVRTYTSELLDPWLFLAAAVEGVSLEVHHVPYGITVQEARPDSELTQFKPDITLFLLRREDLLPELSQSVAGLDAQAQVQLREKTAHAISNLLTPFRQAVGGHLVLTICPAMYGPDLGLYDAQAQQSESRWWSSVKQRIADIARKEIPSCFFLDLDECLSEIGRRNFFNSRLWHSSKFPFSSESAREISRRVVALGASIALPKAKVIVLDADNTLWGGVVGEDGLTGIALGPDYPGSLFVDFQKRLLALQNRGFILALCSKNNETDLGEVLESHPHQVLKSVHFAAKRVNWLPKPENLRSLAAELNLGVESFVFVDDSDHECSLVRAELPQIEVVQTPSRPIDIPTCLDRVARLEVVNLTAEDVAKTRIYQEERQRRELEINLTGDGLTQDQYLSSLKMSMIISLSDQVNLGRLSQLTQKTNQFNISTCRYSEADLAKFMDDTKWFVASFSLADIFGNSGIVGLALIDVSNCNCARLDTFLMSCRVIGRRAESAFLNQLLQLVAQTGVARISARYIPTAKNILVKEFLPLHEFYLQDDGVYYRDLVKNPARDAASFPISITIKNSLSH